MEEHTFDPEQMFFPDPSPGPAEAEYYQPQIPSCGVPLNAVAERLHLPKPGGCPQLIVLGTTCRSGGTALLNCFARAGYRGFFQPMKSILRRLSLGMDAEWSLAQGTEPVVIKESFGPYFREECLLNPVELLLDSGAPPDRIHYVCMLRDPRQVAASWRQWFWNVPGLPRPTRDALVWAYYQSTLIRRGCVEQQISTTTFLCEDVLSLGASAALTGLFDRLGLKCSEEVLDWTGMPQFCHPDSLVSGIREPEVFRIAGILDRVRFGKRFDYCPRSLKEEDCAWLDTWALDSLRADYARAQRHDDRLTGGK